MVRLDNICSKKETPITSPKRLKTIEDLNIVGSPTERNFEVLTILANKFLNTPVSLITAVTGDRQFFISSDGLNEPWNSRRETPLTHSFCQLVVNRRKPLIVTNSKEDILVCDNFAIQDLNVGSYLGYPLLLSCGTVLGSFCVIDSKPREWTDEELATVSKLAEIASSEIEHRKSAMIQKRQAENLQVAKTISHALHNALTTIQLSAEVLEPQISMSNSCHHLENIKNSVTTAKQSVAILQANSEPQ